MFDLKMLNFHKMSFIFKIFLKNLLPLFILAKFRKMVYGDFKYHI